MNTAAKLAAFALAVAAVFGGGYGVGWLVGPVRAAGAGEYAGTAEGAVGDRAWRLPVGGLLVAQDGYRLQSLSGDLTAGRSAEFAFRILGPRGTPVTAFTPTHEKPMHLVLVRRDLAGYQHLHPTMDAEGTWRIPLTVTQGGDYRAFADFRPQGHGEALTLGVDVAVGGEYRPRPLPEPDRSATVDGYTVDLEGSLVPGRAGELALTIRRNGRPVTDLQPYLGAYGHLVVLRDGDLAYLHVHSSGAPGDGTTRPGPRVSFAVDVPSAGAYRFYLDFRHGDIVRTAEFTATASPTAGAPAGATDGAHDGAHDDGGH